MLEKAKIEIKSKSEPNDHVFLRELDRAESEMLYGGKLEKSFFRLGKNLKNGIEENDNTRPAIEKLGEKLNKKLADINPTDLETGFAVVEEIYGKSTGLRGKWVKDLRDFGRAVLSTSNSGAQDYLGFSLKMTKRILKNRTYLIQFRLIANSCFELGYFPKIWKHDIINFIYKRKGSRCDPANWRPITIAPSFGKHLERLFSILISPMNDGNYDNHAYRKRRSCLTAIVDVQRKLMQAKDRLNRGYYGKVKYFSIISADDISGAFERISHKLVAYALELIFICEHDANIKGFVLSYLDRKARAYDRLSNEFCDIIRVVLDQTSPQGSLVSPIFWRIYDNVFVVLYKKNLVLLMDSDADIICIEHVSYADDHVTILTFIIHKNASDAEIGDKMSQLLKIVRDLLGDATKQMGCGINPLKSENIVPTSFAKFIDLTKYSPPVKPGTDLSSFYSKDTFKWLGYFLTLTDFGELVFNIEKIESKIKSIIALKNTMFQYTTSISLKYRLYKTFISPFVELYLPLVIQGKMNKVSYVHDLQHWSICSAIDTPFTTSRRHIERKLGEKSVEEKAKRLSIRLIKDMDIRVPENLKNNTRLLRSRSVIPFPKDKSFTRNFINRLHIFSQMQVEEIAKVKFNAVKVRKFVIHARRRIRDKICDRKRWHGRKFNQRRKKIKRARKMLKRRMK